MDLDEISVLNDEPSTGARGCGVSGRSVVVRRARCEAQSPDDGEPGAEWEARIDSIAELGTRLNHQGTVEEIGATICLELRRLIDYHNVRVYRVVGDEVVPVAWRGEVGTYTGEDGEQVVTVDSRGRLRASGTARNASNTVDTGTLMRH